MVMSWIWTGMLLVSILFSFFTGSGAALAASVLQGAQAGVTLAISIAGSLCLWTGVGRLMEHTGLTGYLAHLLKPLIGRLFPGSREDPALARDLSANICANILGLGNAATPMGISAARRMRRGDTATNELCRLIVLNTASIQLLPATVASLRSASGCRTPFDILPSVWLASILSVAAGLVAAKLLSLRDRRRT